MKFTFTIGFLLALTCVSAIGGMSRPAGQGQERGYENPTLTCPSCYNVPSPLAGSTAKSSMAVPATPFARGAQIIPSSYVSTTYAPNMYLGLDNYYRHRGKFKAYSTRRLLGDSKGFTIVHENNRDRYARPVYTTSKYKLIDGRLLMMVE